MYYYEKVRQSVLMDLLAMHTNRLTQIMIKGESYPGEYDSCKLTIELIQKEIGYKNRTHIFPAIPGNFQNPSPQQ